MTTPDKNEPHPLAPLIEQARRDPFFLGYALAEHARRLGWDDEQLAAHMKCEPERLPRLFLCRCPQEDDPQFAEQVQAIAAFVPCEEMPLLLLLRERAALAKLSGQPAAPANPFFLAARDRHDTDDSDEEENKNENPPPHENGPHEK